MTTLQEANAMSRGAPTRRINFIAGQISMGLDEVSELDPSKEYRLVLLSRVDLPDSQERVMNPNQMFEYLKQLGGKRDSVGYVEIPR